eukprot:15433472-Alexandrium_andersonii.AAC.1
MGTRRRRTRGLTSSRAARALCHHARRPLVAIAVVVELQRKWLIKLLRLLRNTRDIPHVDFLHCGAI